MIYVLMLLTTVLLTTAHESRPLSKRTDYRDSVQEAVQASVRYAIWDVVLRSYRREHTTEADRAQKAHELLGLDSVGEAGYSAPVSLYVHQIVDRAYQQWLDHVRNNHVVSSVCVASTLRECEGSEATTYLKLQDPRSTRDGTIQVKVWEIAVDPSMCRHQDGIVDLQEVDIILRVKNGVWVIEDRIRGDHATSLCSIVGEGP